VSNVLTIGQSWNKKSTDLFFCQHLSLAPIIIYSQYILWTMMTCFRSGNNNTISHVAILIVPTHTLVCHVCKTELTGCGKSAVTFLPLKWYCRTRSFYEKRLTTLLGANVSRVVLTRQSNSLIQDRCSTDKQLKGNTVLWPSQSAWTM